MSTAVLDCIRKPEYIAEEQSLGMSEEATENLGKWLEVIDDYFAPISRQRENIVQRFQDLVFTWKSDTRFYSALPQIVMHPAYLEIIGMGSAAIPLILRELKKKPGHWDLALSAITGDNPIQPDQRGKMAEIAKAWLRWGEEKGYI